MSETPAWKPQQRLSLSLCLVLIHNNNEARTPIIRSDINSMCRILRSVCDIGSFEVAYQPEVTPLSEAIELGRKNLLNDLCCEWEVYRGKEPLVLQPALSVTPAERRSGAVEMMLTDKH